MRRAWRAQALLWSGLILGLVGVVALLAASRPSLAAEVRWSLESLLHPPGAGGRPLQ